MENNKKEPRSAAISIGKRLKDAREKKPLTIEQIQKQTKIHSTVLIALEEGRASEILTDTYVRSFLKKYSQVLGLPTGEILKEYFPPRSDLLSSGVTLQESPLPEETKIGPKVLYFTGIGVLGIVAFLVVFVIGSNVIAFFNKAKLTQATQRQIANISTSKKKISKSVKPTQKKKTTAKTNLESKYVIPRSTQLSLVIKVKEPVLVKLTKDGVRMFATVLPKNLIETITANESIEVEINKTQALELVLNGRQIDLPRKNNIFTLVITRKGVKFK